MSTKEETKTHKEIKVIPTEDLKQEENEVIDISEGKDLSDYSNNDCDNIENDLEDAKKYVLAHLLSDIDLRYNLRLKRKILGSFKKYHEKFVDLLKKLNHKRISLQV